MLFRLFPGRGGSPRLAGWVRRAGSEMHRRGQHEGGRKSPIGAHPDCNGRRGGWLGAVDAMRARRVQWVRAAAGWYSGDGARWERAAARGGDGGAAWRAPWERVTVGRGPDRGKRGPWGGRRRKAALGSGAGGAWVQDAGGGSFLAQWDGCCRRRLLRGWLCREGEMKKEAAYAASLR